MRTREEIKRELEPRKIGNTYYGQTSSAESVIIELLLDIRDNTDKRHWSDIVMDELGEKVPCDCLKGGVDGYERVCKRCGGSEWVEKE